MKADESAAKALATHQTAQSALSRSFMAKNEFRRTRIAAGVLF
jgi:hypothetical protein